MKRIYTALLVRGVPWSAAPSCLRLQQVGSGCQNSETHLFSSPPLPKIATVSKAQLYCNNFPAGLHCRHVTPAMLRYLHRRPKQTRIRTATSHSTEAFERKPAPESTEVRSSSGLGDSSEACGIPEPDHISSYARSGFEGKYDPNPPPRCRICWDLEAAAFPIRIIITRLKSLLQGCCPACNMLHTVLQPWRERFENTASIEINSYSSTVTINLYGKMVAHFEEIQLFAFDGK